MRIPDRRAGEPLATLLLEIAWRSLDDNLYLNREPGKRSKISAIGGDFRAAALARFYNPCYEASSLLGFSIRLLNPPAIFSPRRPRMGGFDPKPLNCAGTLEH